MARVKNYSAICHASLIFAATGSLHPRAAYGRNQQGDCQQGTNRALEELNGHYDLFSSIVMVCWARKVRACDEITLTKKAGVIVVQLCSSTPHETHAV
jgi:hypothetical protein